MLVDKLSGRPANELVAKRSRLRGHLPRHRSIGSWPARLGGGHPCPAHVSARTHLLFASLARLKTVWHFSHLLSVPLVVPCYARAGSVLRKAARQEDYHQLSQRRGTDHLQRFRTGKLVLSRVDQIGTPSRAAARRWY